MLSLMGREIRDHIVFVAAPCVVSLLMIVVAIRGFVYGIELMVFIPLTIIMLMSLVIFCVLGATQMYADRANKVSALLGTLAVTRSRILAARVLVGVLAILAALAPFVVAIVILLKLFVPAAELVYGMTAEIFVTIFLAGLACYCGGLAIGWTTSRVWVIMGSLLMLVAVLSLVYIKGFGPGAMAVLLAFIAATLLHVWHKFTSASI